MNSKGKWLKTAIGAAIDVAAALPLLLVACGARFVRRPFDIGMGLEPLINNIDQKKALERRGYRVWTFANETYSTTWPRCYESSSASPNDLKKQVMSADNARSGVIRWMRSEPCWIA